MTVLPSAFRERIISRKSFRSFGSSEDKASSKTSTDAPVSMASASAIFCFSPPERAVNSLSMKRAYSQKIRLMSSSFLSKSPATRRASSRGVAVTNCPEGS